MIDNRFFNSSIITKELDKDNMNYWFDFKQKKFLHNIDTFYYSVKLADSFLQKTEDSKVIKFRDHFEKKYMAFDGFNISKPYYIKGCEEQLNLRKISYAGFYSINIECPEMFDIFIAPVVPEAADHDGRKIGYSTTCEIIVQIRSYMLWLYGIHESFERSYDVVKNLCKEFGFTIGFVQENRIDYCWHTNYHSNPEKFFNIENLMKMEVSRYKRIHQEFEKIGNEGQYEMDYLCLGKRSDKCFIRIYLKSKEVVEQGYKQFFFKIWLFQGLINRYDLYCLEQSFEHRSWRYMDVARLNFYIEYGNNEILKEQCREYVNKDKYDYAAIRNLANQLTPKINLIMNIEYQTMRRHTKSYSLMELKDNKTKYQECKRVYDYLDNRPLIIEYLTRETFRLVEPNVTDLNKSRRELCPFWKALRSTKLIDMKLPNKQLKLLREYCTKLDKDVIKRRLINSCVTYGLYTRGINTDDVLLDCTEALLRMNDNDIKMARKYKEKKKRLINADELAPLKDNDSLVKNYTIIDDDGVIYDYHSIKSLSCQKNNLEDGA